MNSNFLQSFYKNANDYGQKVAIRIATRHRQWFIPNWQLRSKSKHFALGLMHAGVGHGERVFLSSHFHPNYVFTDLGSLVAGLETLTLPPLLHPDILKSWLEKFHPTVFYAGGSISGACQEVIRHWKHFKVIVDAPAYWVRDKRQFTFRELFNAGIVNERELFFNYRSIKDQRRPDDLMTPEGSHTELAWCPLKYQTVEDAKSAFGLRLPHTKTSRFLIQMDLSSPDERLLGLYWPLSTSSEVLWIPPEVPPESSMHTFQPQVALLQRATLERLAAEVAVSPKKNWGLPWIKNQPWRKRVGKKLQLLWMPGNGPLPTVESGKFPFRMELMPSPPLSNFPLVKK